MDLMRLLAIVGAFAALIVPASATDDDPIDALLQLSQYDAMLDDTRASCIAAAAEMSPESIVREYPAYLGGATPESDAGRASRVPFVSTTKTRAATSIATRSSKSCAMNSAAT